LLPEQDTENICLTGDSIEAWLLEHYLGSLITYRIFIGQQHNARDLSIRHCWVQRITLYIGLKAETDTSIFRKHLVATSY